MKTIHHPNTIRSHFVTIVPMVPFTPKSTSKLRSALHFRYIRKSSHALILFNPNNHYNHVFLSLLTTTTMFIVTILCTVVVVVDPLLPAYWGESASVVLWGFAASFSRQSSSRAATPEGSLHKSRADSVVGICGQLKRCVVCS